MDSEQTRPSASVEIMPTYESAVNDTAFSRPQASNLIRLSADGDQSSTGR
jgi:hypothetical protein